MKGMMTVAGALTVFTCLAIAQAIRWRREKRFWSLAGIGVSLGILAGGALWAGTRYPTANFFGNAGFGPDWECTIGKGAAGVCRRSHPMIPAKPSAPMRPSTVPAN